MGELSRWNEHRARSDRSQEYTAPRNLINATASLSYGLVFPIPCVGSNLRPAWNGGQEQKEEVVSYTEQRQRELRLGVKRTQPPTPGRAAPALSQSPEASSPPPLPPSTAPARLYTGKGGRERKRTSKGATAKAEGWLPKSQPRE